MEQVQRNKTLGRSTKSQIYHRTFCYNMDVLAIVLGYDCGANNPCTTTNEGSYFPHEDPVMYISCGTATQCNELTCPMNTIWDQEVSTCISSTK